MTELRCRSKKHGEAIDDHTVEIMCRSKFCGAITGEIIVLHRFDLRTGKVVQTRKFREKRIA